MKKIFLFILPVSLLLGACTKDISSYNGNSKQPTTVPAGPLFTYAEYWLNDALADCGAYNNIFRHIVEYWSQATNEDVAQYNFNLYNVPDNWWQHLYVNVLSNFHASDSILSQDKTDLPATVANERAIIDVLEVYTFNTLVNSFGNVPYSQALNSNNLTPVFDDAKTIQADLLARLTTDLSNMTAANPSFTATQDLLYGGNVASWIALANSLKIQIAMTLADVDNTTAQTVMEASNSAAFQSTATDAVWSSFTTAYPNPLYTNLVLSGRTDYLACQTLMNYLTTMNDPRLPTFFATNTSGMYVGSPIGLQEASTGAFSKPGAIFYTATCPYVFMDYMNMEFYRAEAIERGYNVPGTAEQHYDSAIALSIRYYGGTNAQAQAYLAQPSVAYSTAGGGTWTWRQKIGFQKWLALYGRGMDSYTELRRFDWPTMVPPVGAISGFPYRMTYPATTVSEQVLNPVNYAQAAAAIGGDLVSTKLYWDVN